MCGPMASTSESKTEALVYRGIMPSEYCKLEVNLELNNWQTWPGATLFHSCTEVENLCNSQYCFQKKKEK